MPEALVGLASQSFMPALKLKLFRVLIASLLLAKKVKQFRLGNALSLIALASKLYSLKQAVF
jgi:hypothetical protein